ncbi:uncharacterized protein [Anabrus simplex]|uniref:uncharacterized protein n=1 Tax=Anabrus simplex TaxID=316456 RepID=UPI0035A29E1B
MGCVVKQCCCGCTLKTGSIVIGILEAVGCGIGLIPVITGAAAFFVFRDAPLENHHATEELIQAFRATMEALGILTTVVALIIVIQLIFAIILACGANQEKPSLIYPWIIYSNVSLVLTGIFYIIIACIEIANSQVVSGVVSLFTCALFTALRIYFIIVVNSYHLELTRPGAVNACV